MMRRSIISIFILISFVFPGLSFAAQPSAINNLTVSNPMPNSVTLTWTTPGSGDQYDVRYSTSPITEHSWSSAIMTTGAPTPAQSGSQQMVVTFLEPNTTYYFAIKTQDFVPFGQGVGLTESALSNVVSATTAARTGNVYYVAQSDGNDSYNGRYDSFQGGSNGPWKSIMKAANTLQAGDIVYIRAGTYDERGNWYGTFGADGGGISPMNSGTAGNNIVYTSYPGETPIIEGRAHDGAANRHNGFEIRNVSYIVIDNLHIQNAWYSGFTSGTLGGSNNFIMIRNCEVKDTYVEPGDHLSSGIISGGISSYHIYRNNTLYGARDQSNTDNCFGILMYYTYDSLVDGNHLYDNAMGVDVKAGSCRRIEVCHNRVHDGSIGITLGNDSDYCQIFENIIYDNRRSAIVISYNTDIDYTRIWNNTAYNTGLGLDPPYQNIGMVGGIYFHHSSSNVQMWNNIFSKTHVDWGLIYITDTSVPMYPYEFDYNNYHHPDGTYTAFIYGESPGKKTFSQWKTYCQDNPDRYPSVTDQNSFVDDPLFVDPENADFRLRENSPCKGAGYGGVDMGAYPKYTPPDCSDGIDPGELACYEFCQCTDGTCDCPVYPVPTNLNKPAKGETIIDPNFHTRITRITDADNDLGSANRHMRINYTRFDIANCDGSMILLASSGVESGWHLYDGNTFEYIKTLNSSLVGWDTSIEQRWDPTDPDVFYFRYGTVLYKYIIGDTDTREVVHNFKDEYPTATTIANGEEGNCSRDRRYWAFIVAEGYTPLAVVVYDKDTDTIVGTKTTNLSGINWVSMSPLGNRVVLGYPTVRSYARDFTDEVIVGSPAGHCDTGLDADGNEVFIYFSDIGGGNDYLCMARLDTGQETKLINWNPLYGYNGCHNSGGHISGLDNLSKPGWAVVGTHGAYQNAACWPDQSIYLVELKENPRVWRIAHHHSYYSGYGANPFATINRAGTKIFFNSNWDSTVGGLNDLDVYQVELPSTWHEDLGGEPIVNNPPTANASANPTSGVAPLTVNFTSSGSDSDGTIVSWNWNFGDGGTSTQQSPTHTYNNAGNYTATLTVTDNGGAKGTDTVSISVTPGAGQYLVVFGNATGSDYPGTCQDTFVNSGASSVNYSTNSLSLNTYTWPANTVANRILIKWDVSAIPSNATINSATLSLYMYGYEGAGGDDQYEISMHKIINHNPVISTCIWNAYDGVNAWTGGANGGVQDMASTEDTNTIDKTAGYKPWTVTNMVQNWVSNPSSNFGMMLDSDSTAASDSNRYFRPMEYSNANQRPKLVVTYTIGEQPLTITTENPLPDATVGTQYNLQLETSGGSP